MPVLLAAATAAPSPAASASPSGSWFALGPLDWVAIGALATLLGVAAALVIAIWGQSLQALLFKPRLAVSIEMRPPDAIRIQAATGFIVGAIEVPGPLPGAIPVAYSPAYYCRLRVSNEGNREAQDVEVKLLRERVLPNGGIGREDVDFMPLNLKWADSGEVTAKRIAPKLFRHCDLCRVLSVAPDKVEYVTEVTPNELRPGVWPTKKRPGNYEVDLAVSANNAKLVTKSLRVSFVGWFDDDKQMFEKGLVVRVIR